MIPLTQIAFLLFLEDFIWGREHKDIPFAVSSENATPLIDFLSARPYWQVLGLADVFLPPFRCKSASISSARASKASKTLPSHIALKFVVEDPEWMEDLEELAKDRWKLNDTEPSHLLPEWKKLTQKLTSRAEGFSEMLSGDDGVFDETSEAKTDTRAGFEVSFMNALFQVSVPLIRSRSPSASPRKRRLPS
ncbi:hypothetical protein B0H19DRAFT_514856 [Mycena capillaripes]|nr:hypothetical protein B0H19DRAFT_514856 [Mycena capillaripes]